MRYIDEYRDRGITQKLIKKMLNIVSDYSSPIVLMEVCGTHTMSIFRSGLRNYLPDNIRLISGPGCPVCVTPNSYLDKAIAYARKDDVIIVTFGDMIRVPGSSSNLEKEKSTGRQVRVVYSCLDALSIAQDNPDKKVIFLGVGFETTVPTLAATIKIAKEKKIRNFFVFSGHKVIPPAMQALVKERSPHIDGFICPGHVSTIIGSKPYEFIVRDYHVPCVIAGFEPVDVTQAIFMLAQQIVEKKSPVVEIQYSRSVKEEGNRKALDLMEEVFESEDSNWRGLGIIPESGLKIKQAFSDFDAELSIEVEVEMTKEDKGCICGAILRGIKTPLDCVLFKKQCRPENPIGACMVSSEGTCAAYFKYGK
ncbi:MAG: hydrogenase formation protein HypD [Candidatus Omnitrophica bacterium]|nr:hydrogenase formation protein HypD [Candidatus Omnitrophota bacterium]